MSSIYRSITLEAARELPASVQKKLAREEVRYLAEVKVTDLPARLVLVLTALGELDVEEVR